MENMKIEIKELKQSNRDKEYRDKEYQEYMEYMNKQICSVMGISKKDLNQKIIPKSLKFNDNHEIDIRGVKPLVWESLLFLLKLDALNKI